MSLQTRDRSCSAILSEVEEESGRSWCGRAGRKENVAQHSPATPMTGERVGDLLPASITKAVDYSGRPLSLESTLYITLASEGRHFAVFLTDSALPALPAQLLPPL